MLRRCFTVIIAVIMLLTTASCLSSGGDSHIYITEIVSRNKTLIYDVDGESSDYIEIYNSGDTDVNLHGWFLSDKENKPKKYSFPDVTVKAGEYLVVFCSGKDFYDEESGEIHTNFKLDGDGEVISLVSDKGVIIALVQFGEIIADASYGLTEDLDGEYMWFERGTPNEKNSGTYYPSLDKLPTYQVVSQ